MPAHRRLCLFAMADAWVLQRVNYKAFPQKTGILSVSSDCEQLSGGELMRRIGIKTGIVGGLVILLVALFASAALAVVPGTFKPTSDSFNPANAPGSSHLAKGSPSPECVVNASLDVNCNAYVLGGVGHTNATINLAATYSATVDCFNPGNNPNNPVESHTTTFTATSTATVASTKNGQLNVPAQSVSAGQVGQVCPNPNWTPKIRPGTLTLNSFTYTLTFAGFSSPYITITASDP